MKDWLSLGILASAVLLGGCNKTTSDEPAVPEENITFSPAAVETKGMISSSEFKTEGTSVKILDVLSFNGAEEEYLNDTISYKSSAWPLKSGKSYAWTRTGTHRFFGWLAKDAVTGLTPTDLWTSGITYADKVLTIPSVSTDFTSSAQFDMLYSDVILRTMTNSSTDDHSTVTPRMQHLFSAVSFGISNQLKDPVTLKEIRIQGIKNTGSATIIFSGSATAVKYSAFTGSLSRSWSRAEGIIIPSKTEVADAFDPEATQRNIRLMWPLSWDDLDPGILGTDYGFDSSGNMIGNTTSPLIYITYVINNVEHTSPVPLTENLDWTPGMSVRYEIVFADKQVLVTAKVSPWDYQENDIDYESETVSISSGCALDIDATYGHCTKVGTEVTFTDGLHVRSNFTLATPTGGTWIVELAGTNAEAFELFDSPTGSAVATVSGAIGSKAEFYIKPKSGLENGTYICKIKVTAVTMSGRYVNADAVVQAGDHALTYIHIIK